MISIFYDLETSDTNPIGQILNYSFIAVDEDWKIVDELTDNIKISRTELPRAGAILANRINVIEHQGESPDSEPEGALKIHKFLNAAVKKYGKCGFIGYNSSGFDLNYLRTTLIRSGLNPYFNGKLSYGDLFLAVKKLSVSHPDFPRNPARGGDSDKLSLKMETISDALGLLEGVQTHYSRDDVILTIDLARKLHDDFDLDVRNFSAYEPETNIAKGLVKGLRVSQRDLTRKGIYETVPMLHLCSNHRYAIWVDLQKFADPEESYEVRLFKKDGGPGFFQEEISLEPEMVKFKVEALEKYKSLNLGNFFEKSSCDVEQDIYRLDFQDIDLLNSAIWYPLKGDAPSFSKKEARSVYLRYLLKTYQWGGAEDDRFHSMLQKYAAHRYGGKLQLWRKVSDEQVKEGKGNHPSYNELKAEILEKREAEGVTTEDLDLLDALDSFYNKSDIASHLKN